MSNVPWVNWALEKEESYDEIYQSKGTLGKLLMKLLGRLRYLPQVTFQKEDIDEVAVGEIMKHKDLLTAVERWITETDYSLLPKLREAKRVFEVIQPPKQRGTLYRGFPSKNTGPEEGFKTIDIGQTYSYVPTKMMSFSFNRGTSEDFGDVIVGVEFEHEQHRMLHITNEIVMAYLVRHVPNFMIREAAKFPTFGESVFLPDNRPLNLTLVSNGRT